MDITFIIIISSTIIEIILLVIFVIMYRKRTKKKKPDVGKIYTTTDGYLASNIRNKKKRIVAVVDQRDDKAVAVAKIYSKKDKNNKNCIEKVVLSPSDHSSLTVDSLVGKRIIIGRENEKGKKVPIYTSELSSTKDYLTKKEFTQIKRNLGGKKIRNKITTKKKMRKWHKHFKK